MSRIRSKSFFDCTIRPSGVKSRATIDGPLAAITSERAAERSAVCRKATGSRPSAFGEHKSFGDGGSVQSKDAIDGKLGSVSVADGTDPLPIGCNGIGEFLEGVEASRITGQQQKRGSLPHLLAGSGDGRFDKRYRPLFRFACQVCDLVGIAGAHGYQDPPGGVRRSIDDPGKLIGAEHRRQKNVALPERVCVHGSSALFLQ